MAVAGNIRTANYFRLDWVKQQRLYTQIAERIPDLEPGTMIISEELGTILPSSTFLSAYVNWLYDQTSQGFPRVTYYFDYLAHDESVENINDLVTDQRVLHAYPFTGNPEQIVGMTYINNCFVVLDPELDPLNPYIAQNIQEISSYSRRDMILPDRVDIPSALRFTVNENTVYPWCLAFLQADLAGQFGQWESVVEIADSSLELFPLGSSMGRFFTVFIEGYVHTGRVSEAVDLTASVLENYPETNPMLCRLWDRILLESGEGLSIGLDPVDTGILFNCQ